MGNYFSRKELVYTVYQEGSISKAAQKLFISQPSLSVMIQKIEEDVGVPLFDRTSKPIRLTEAGQEYIKATEEMLHIEKSFRNYLEACQNLQTGSLTIGSNQLLSSLVLPRYIGQFLQKYPNIHLNLVDDNSASLENLAMAGYLDLVLDNHLLDRTLFEQHILRKEWLLLAVPKSFSCNAGLEKYQLSYEDVVAGKHLTEGEFAPLSAFGEIPYVAMTRQNETRRRSDEIFHDAGMKPHNILEIDRLVTLYSFVEQGSAASIVSDTLVQYLQNHNDNVVFYRLNSPHACRELYISYKKNRYYSRAMEAFVSLIGDISK